MITFIENLKRFMQENNLSVNEFAKKANVSAKQAEKWLKGTAEARCKTLKKICKAFNVSADYFLGLTDNY